MHFNRFFFFIIFMSYSCHAQQCKTISGSIKVLKKYGYIMYLDTEEKEGKTCGVLQTKPPSPGSLKPLINKLDGFIDLPGADTLDELKVVGAKLFLFTMPSLPQVYHLQSLDLSDCFIREILKDAFNCSGCYELQHLNLSSNKIEKLNKEAFVGLAQLKALNLSFNNLIHTQIDPQAFNHLPEKTEINLSGNPLVSEKEPNKKKALELLKDKLEGKQKIFYKLKRTSTV